MIIEIIFYSYKDGVGLVELVLDSSFMDIKESLDFCIEDRKISKSNWQTLYMEQYLNKEGTEKICETYSEPSLSTHPIRIAFFIFGLKQGQKLVSSFGDTIVRKMEPLPDRLKTIIEFDDFT